jgi:hypothetical protein
MNKEYSNSKNKINSLEEELDLKKGENKKLLQDLNN